MLKRWLYNITIEQLMPSSYKFSLCQNNFFFQIPDTCTAVIIPLVQKFCDEIPKQCSETLLTVAKLFGKLSYGLSGEDDFPVIVLNFC